MTNEQFDRLETLLVEAAEKLLTTPDERCIDAGSKAIYALVKLMGARRCDRAEMRQLEREFHSLKQTIQGMVK